MPCSMYTESNAICHAQCINKVMSYDMLNVYIKPYHMPCSMYTESNAICHAQCIQKVMPYAMLNA